MIDYGHAHQCGGTRMLSCCSDVYGLACRGCVRCSLNTQPISNLTVADLRRIIREELRRAAVSTHTEEGER